MPMIKQTDVLTLTALVGVILLAALGVVNGDAVLTFLVGLGLKSPIPIQKGA